MRITIGNLKGGVGKSKAAWFLATGLAKDGPTLAVDADPQSQTLLDSYNRAVERGYDVPFEVLPFATNDLARKVGALADRYQHVVIDTGGETAALFRAACAVAGELVIPVAPFEEELRRLPATFTAAREVEELTGNPVYPRVLLSRVDSTTLDGPAAREFLAGAGLPTMRAQIRRAVLYSRAFGHVPDDLGDYAAVLDELRAEAAA